MTLESAQKDLAAKDTEINRLLASKKRASDSTTTVREELERRVRDMEQRIDADRQAFQAERSQWTGLEGDRDQVREQLARQVEIGERCRQEVEHSEEQTRALQDQLAQEKLKRLDVERRIAQNQLNETEIERSRVEMNMQLRARNKEMREIKHALESRGISLEFLIGKNIATMDSPVVTRKLPSAVASTPPSTFSSSSSSSSSSLRASADAMSPSSDFASPPRSVVTELSRAPASAAANPSDSMEMVLSAPDSCDSPRHSSDEQQEMNKRLGSSLVRSSDSEKSSLGGSISVDASLSSWKKKVEGASSGALWGVRRKEMAEQRVTKAPQKSAKATQRGPTKGGSRRMNPAAAAALRRAELQRTTIKEL